MKRFLQVFTCLTLIVGVHTSTVQAQSSSKGVNVAVVDVSHIFKQHQRFTQSAEQIKESIKAFEQQMLSQRKQMEDQRKQLSTLKPGSPEYKNIESALARRVSAVKVDAELKRKDVLEQEAQLYYDTYKEIQQAIQTVANKYGIGLVLRFNSKPIDVNDRADVISGVNRAVVYQKNIDITKNVLTVVNGRAATRPVGPARR